MTRWDFSKSSSSHSFLPSNPSSTLLLPLVFYSKPSGGTKPPLQNFIEKSPQLDSQQFHHSASSTFGKTLESVHNSAKFFPLYNKGCLFSIAQKHVPHFCLRPHQNGLGRTHFYQRFPQENVEAFSPAHLFPSYALTRIAVSGQCGLLAPQNFQHLSITALKPFLLL